ncbi:MAG: YvcK family protein [Candidatus Promineofilum sp.]|nr:YvcK family protein [Promineifilum sp.]
MSRLRALWRFLYIRRRWLTIGIGVKRWLVLLVAGAAVTSMGWVYLLLTFNREGWLPGPLYDALTLRFLPLWLRVALPLLVGGLIILVAVIRLGKSLVEPLRGGEGAVVDSLYDFRRRDRGPQIVAIGGGTGLPGLLRGLTPFTSNITAIVTVADDGGSSGRLRREMGLLPPGDFRNNLAALARDEALMTQVLQYRFGGQVPGARDQVPGEEAPSVEPGPWPLEPSLSGHAFGNLLLAALTGITGSFDEALLAAQRVLALRGQVLPSTLDNVTLVGEVVMPDGTTQIVTGESAIPKAGGRVERVRLEPADAALSAGAAGALPGRPDRPRPGQPLHQHPAQPAAARSGRGARPRPRAGRLRLQPGHPAGGD